MTSCDELVWRICELAAVRWRKSELAAILLTDHLNSRSLFGQIQQNDYGDQGAKNAFVELPETTARQPLRDRMLVLATPFLNSNPAG